MGKHVVLILGRRASRPGLQRNKRRLPQRRPDAQHRIASEIHLYSPARNTADHLHLGGLKRIKYQRVVDKQIVPQGDLPLPAQNRMALIEVDQTCLDVNGRAIGRLLFFEQDAVILKALPRNQRATESRMAADPAAPHPPG